MWLLLQAAAPGSTDSGLGPISVVINSLWVLFALSMLAVAFFFFRRWDRRAKFSAQQSDIAPPAAPGTLAGGSPDMPMPRDTPQSRSR